MTVVNVPLRDLGKWEKKIGRRLLKSTLKDAMTSASRPMIAVVRSNTASAPPASSRGKPGVYYKGRFFKSWRAVVDGIAMALTIKNTSHHAAVVEFGRRAGAPLPPLKPIKDWVRAKITKGNRVRGERGRFLATLTPLAWKIARAIARRGLRGRFVLWASHLELTSIFVKHITNAYSRLLSGSMGAAA